MRIWGNRQAAEEDTCGCGTALVMALVALAVVTAALAIYAVLSAP